MEERSRALKGILILAIVFFLVVLVFAFFSVKIISKSDSVSLGNLGKNDVIAVVEIQGVIMDAKKTVELLLKAEERKNIKALIVRIDSPGGAVGPTQEIYEELRRIDEKIPVYASFGSIAASGGYYIGAAARKIFANKGTLTGSIGVIMNFMDLSKVFELAKVKPEVIKAGRYKDIGNMAREMTFEEKQLLTSTTDRVHQQFREDILARRKDKIKMDFVELTQGQIFSGSEAFDAGLIDEIGSLWQAGRSIHKELGLSGEFKDFLYIKPKKKFNWLEFAEEFDDAKTFFNNLTKLALSPVQMLAI